MCVIKRRNVCAQRRRNGGATHVIASSPCEGRLIATLSHSALVLTAAPSSARTHTHTHTLIQADEIIDACEDHVVNAIVAVMRAPSDEAKAAAREKAVTEHIPKFLGFMNSRLEANGTGWNIYNNMNRS